MTESHRLFDYKNKKVITEHDSSKVEELLSSDDYKKLDIPKLTELEQKANEIYSKYEKESHRVKNSDNPLLQSDEVQAYELDKIEKEMREQSAAVEKEWQEYRANQYEEARKRAAQATVKVSDDDKLTAEQFVTRASLKLTSAYDGNKGELLLGIIDEIGLLTDGQRVAMQSQIGRLLDGLEDVDKRKLVQAVQDVRNEDILALDVARQLPHSVLTKQRIRDIAKGVVSDDGQESIGRDFYEKYLKAGGKK